MIERAALHSRAAADGRSTASMKAAAARQAFEKLPRHLRGQCTVRFGSEAGLEPIVVERRTGRVVGDGRVDAALQRMATARQAQAHAAIEERLRPVRERHARLDAAKALVERVKAEATAHLG